MTRKNKYKKESHKKVPKEKVDAKENANHPKEKDLKIKRKSQSTTAL